MLDRLVHHAEILSLKGESYRLKDRDLGPIQLARRPKPPDRSQAAPRRRPAERPTAPVFHARTLEPAPNDETAAQRRCNFNRRKGGALSTGLDTERVRDIPSRSLTGGR
jgi:hypothetical protein